METGLIEQLGPLQLPAWVTAIAVVLYVLREPIAKAIPPAFNIFGRRSEHEAKMRELAEQRAEDKADFERQDNIAIMQSMMSLQGEAIRQNEKLLDFLMDRLDRQIVAIGEDVRERLSGVKEDIAGVRRNLDEIKQRWAEAYTASDKSTAELAIVRQEVATLVIQMRRAEEKIDRAAELEFELANERRVNRELKTTLEEVTK